MPATFAPVSGLPESLRLALSTCGYAKRDVAVEARDTYRFESAYGDGFRAYAVAVDLGTGDMKVLVGNWGGASPLHTAQVDGDQDAHPLPLNGAVITGQTGGGRPVSARIVVHPDNVAKLLPAAPEATDRDRALLAIFGGIKSSYRREYLASAKATDAEIESLVTRGYLSRNKAGSIAITTAGKNARGNARA